MRDSPGLYPDESALKIPAGDISFTELAIGDLPLSIVITSQVFNVDLPVKEFPGEDVNVPVLETLGLAGLFEIKESR